MKKLTIVLFLFFISFSSLNAQRNKDKLEIKTKISSESSVEIHYLNNKKLYKFMKIYTGDEKIKKVFIQDSNLVIETIKKVYYFKL